ncbi:hypothetical protein [Streptomyces noursei]|uniref:hypothetical protein n=1 Tax=Streptomyces noursei TaxID=1971 RepID=UPI0037F5DA30
MTTDPNTLSTALYVKSDDEIGGTRRLGRLRLLRPLSRFFLGLRLGVGAPPVGHNAGAGWGCSAGGRAP